MNPEQAERYSRQTLLPEIGADGQERLLAASALIVGCGGLGSPVVMYLASAGVGRLVLVDYDRVELSNLQRQIVHDSDAVGELKVDSAARTVRRLNPGVRVETVPRELDGDELLAAVTGCDVVVDASDNFATRFALNRACVRVGRPLVSGAAMRWEGQVAVYDPRRGESPCYRCLYADDGAPGETCARIGVVAPLLGVIGSLQAMEALKVLLGAGRDLAGRLLVVDALSMEIRTLRLGKDPACPVCATG